MLYGAEVDCVDHTLETAHFPPPENFVEIKASVRFTLKHKLQQWWAQSFLVGIPRVLVACHEGDGIVDTLQIIKTESIPRIAARTGCAFEPTKMIDFLEEFLTFVNNVVEEEEVVYCFESKPEWEEIRFSSDSDKTKG